MSGKICPDCRGLSAIDVSFCANCGHQFKTKFIPLSGAARTYELLREDGSVFGPANTSLIQGWINSGVVSPTSRIRTSDGLEAFARDLPELQAMLTSVRPLTLDSVDLKAIQGILLSPIFGAVILIIGLMLFVNASNHANSPGVQFAAAFGGDNGLGTIIFAMGIVMTGIFLIIISLYRKKLV